MPDAPQECADPTVRGDGEGLGMVRIHASVVVWGEHGVLIRGPSGAGKSTLASSFVDQGRRCRTFSRLVADDVVALRAAGGRIVARPHPGIAGLIERRGLGLLAVDHEPACVVRLVVDLVEAPERLPEPDTLRVSLIGIMVPRLALAQGAPATDNVYHALQFVASFTACS